MHAHTRIAVLPKIKRWLILYRHPSILSFLCSKWRLFCVHNVIICDEITVTKSLCDKITGNLPFILLVGFKKITGNLLYSAKCTVSTVTAFNCIITS